ncbi:MAG: hypothetical protein XD41_0587 [Desulfonauticus sp. 38_4375]|nr:MAG: hypothetical protein XD41_0587 [Desulfonauticus sp. 38_4375]
MKTKVFLLSLFLLFSSSIVFAITIKIEGGIIGNSNYFDTLFLVRRDKGNNFSLLKQGYSITVDGDKQEIIGVKDNKYFIYFGAFRDDLLPLPSTVVGYNVLFFKKIAIKHYPFALEKKQNNYLPCNSWFFKAEPLPDNYVVFALTSLLQWGKGFLIYSLDEKKREINLTL